MAQTVAMVVWTKTWYFIKNTFINAPLLFFTVILCIQTSKNANAPSINNMSMQDLIIVNTQFVKRWSFVDNFRNSEDIELTFT